MGVIENEEERRERRADVCAVKWANQIMYGIVHEMGASVTSKLDCSWT